MEQTAQRLEAEILQRLGFVPPFFLPAREDPHVLGELWRHTLSAYLDNPLPDLFKEKLTALLSRHCAVPYCFACHSASMRPLGLGGEGLLKLLEAKNPLLAGAGIRPGASSRPWTDPGSPLETWVLACCEAIFLHIDWERAQAWLRELVGGLAFDRILMLISYVRACLDWISAHPAIRHEDDLRVKQHLGPLMAEEPRLARFFAEHQGVSKGLALRWISHDNLLLLQELQKSNDALKQREESMRRLMDAAPCIVWETDAHGLVRYFNAAWGQYTKRTADELLGSRSLEMVHPEHRQAYLSQWRQHQRDSSEFETVLQLRGSQGGYRWFLVRVVPIRGADQRPKRWLGTAVDIDDLKIASSAERHQLSLLSTAVALGGVGYFDWNIAEDRFDLSERFRSDWQIDSGVSLEQILEHLHPEDLPRVRAALEAALAGEAPYQITYRILRRDGSFAWIDAQGSVTYSAQGQPTRFFGTTVDVSRRMREREAAVSRRRRLEDVLNQMPSPVLMFEPKSRCLTFSNQAAQSMFGGPLPESPEACRMHGPAESEATAGRSDARWVVEQAASGEQLDNAAMRWDTPTGTYDILASTTLLPGFEDHPAIIVCNLRDITKIKAAETRLSGAIQALKSQSSVRERFVSALSHDLRAPIAVGLMTAQLIARRSGRDPEYIAKATQRIEASMMRADRMICDLLDANRIEAGQSLALAFTPFHMDEFLAEAVADLNQIHDGCVVFRSASGRVSGVWDPNALRRVVDNLVGNAVKYGERGTEVTVSLSQNARGVVLSVHNQGAAIAPDDQEKLFDPYARARSAVESGQQGWGIGLALVKEIARQHGGEVAVESRGEQGGTTFSVNLPLDAAQAARSPN